MSACYGDLFAQAKAEGRSDADAADRAATAFLAGRPARRGQHKITAHERHVDFWSAGFLAELPSAAWRQDSLVLALAKYLGQDTYACSAIVDHLAVVAPDVLQRAARYAGLVGRPGSPSWREIQALAARHPQAFGEFVRILEMFRQARAERQAEIERFRQLLAALTPLALLVYASLFAFEHLVPAHLQQTGADKDGGLESSWDAIEAILAWKLETGDPSCLVLDERAIGLTMREHLSPFLFPSRQMPPRRDLYAAFCALVDAQIELDAFDARSADAFSYDDSIRFVARGDVLEIDVVDPDAKAAWETENDKLLRLHRYWLYRGMDALLASPELLARVSPAHTETNLQALAKAFAAWLRLQEVYGVAAQMTMADGQQLDVFGALKAVELMTAFCIEDFMRPYAALLQRGGHPWLALGRLAFDGFSQGENRLPLSWSERSAKIARIQPWTATREHPAGDPQAAEAIIDFWTSDWDALAKRLRRGEPELRPRLHERPLPGMGHYLFQLPWLLAMQNNTVSAINNLRRLGARRNEARAETMRIEQRLGQRFGDRGFRVLVGHRLATGSCDDLEGEEIDLLCASDGLLLVLELKSTFVRRSLKEAWLHRTSTLRKAGLQLQRKTAAVRRALVCDHALRRTLGLSNSAMLEVVGWIVDTSIECDHEHFVGFLKVSLEEVLIALGDERHLLNDPRGLFGPDGTQDGAGVQGRMSRAVDTLYPDGFSAGRFVEVVKAGAVWARPA